MRSERQCDWHGKESYAYTWNLTRLGWAWEFVRRNSAFQADVDRGRLAVQGRAKTKTPFLQGWGMLRADDPSKTALDVRVFWDPAVCPHVLPLFAATEASTDPATRSAALHVLICDGTRRLQLAVQLAPHGDSLLVLTDAVVLPHSASCRWRSLKCFNDYLFSGALARRHFRSERTAGRLARVLQALDGALAGASHREIAIVLFGHARVTADWNDPSENLRDSVRRAVRRGRMLMNGGYREFLR